MRFGTFFFFQAAPGLSHADVVHRELAIIKTDPEPWRHDLRQRKRLRT
jgi:hypothetical protein